MAQLRAMGFATLNPPYGLGVFVAGLSTPIGCNAASSGLVPTKISTAPGGNSNPYRVTNAISPGYSGCQCTPKNIGPSGGPKSKLSKLSTAFAAVPAADIGGWTSSGWESGVSFFNDERRFQRSNGNPSLREKSWRDVGSSSSVMNLTFHPDFFKANPISDASIFGSEFEFDCINANVPAYFSTAFQRSFLTSSSPSRPPMAMRRAAKDLCSNKLSERNFWARSFASAISLPFPI